MDSQEAQESEEVRYAIKYKQESRRVEIRRKQLVQTLGENRRRIASQAHDFTNEGGHEELGTVLTSEKAASIVEKLGIKFNLKDFDGCEEIVRTISRYCSNGKVTQMKVSLEEANKTDIPLFLIAFINSEIELPNNCELFKMSLKILQNIPAVATSGQVDKLVEYRVIDQLLNVLDLPNVEDDSVNNALYSLANFCASGRTSVKNQLFELNALSKVSRFNQFDVFRENLLFFYQSALASFHFTLTDFSLSDRVTLNLLNLSIGLRYNVLLFLKSVMDQIIFYLLNCLRNSYEASNESDISEIMWAIQSFAKIEALVQLDQNSDYVMLLNILDAHPTDNIIIPTLKLMNNLAYNSDKNIDELVAFGAIDYLNKYADNASIFIRTNAVYALLNMAASQEQYVKKTLLDANLVAKLQTMMQLDSSNDVKKLCFLFFSNLLYDADEIFIRRAIQDYYFFAVCKQAFEMISDVEVIYAILNTLLYIFQCIDSSDIIEFIIDQAEYYNIEKYVEDLTNQNFEHLSIKAQEILERIQELKDSMS